MHFLERCKHHFDVKHLHEIKGLLSHVFVILNLADVSKEGIKFQCKKKQKMMKMFPSFNNRNLERIGDFVGESIPTNTSFHFEKF